MAIIGRTTILIKKYKGPMENWLEFGIYPGSFLGAILRNDLLGALGHANDSVTLESLHQLTRWCYWQLPGPAWGSKDKVEAWAKARKSEQGAAF